MGRLSRRLRALATAGAMVAGTAGMIGAAQPASASPNLCTNYQGYFWSTQQDMVDAETQSCRQTWVVDPGIGQLLNPGQLVQHTDLYEQNGISRQFLWYAPRTQVTIPSGSSQRWSACDDYPLVRDGNACLPGNVNNNPQHTLSFDFGSRTVTLDVLKWGANWIALACGNYSLDLGAFTPPVPTVSGIKFDDANRDHVQDNGEGGVGGITFDLIRDSSYYGDQGTGFVKSTTSAADGSFSFALNGEGPGNYTVKEEPSSDWVPTTDAAAHFTVAPNQGAPTYQVSFGNRAENPPNADPGPAQKVDQAGPGGTWVTLDGSNSSDPDGDPIVSYTWTWGDGQSTTGEKPTIELGPGTWPITLVVNDGMKDSSPKTTYVTVYPPITLQGQNVSSQEGQSFSGVVGTFTDPDPDGPADEYKATVDWGDGTPPSDGVISKGTDGTFSVNAGHTYAEEGTYSPTVTVTDTEVQFNHATAPFTATVSDASLAAQGKKIISLLPLDQALATFTDQNPGAPLSDFTATIDWGDGTAPTAGVITGPTGGPFTVSGQHTYAEPGPETITINVLDEGGQTAQAVDQAIIGDLSSGGNFVIGDQNAAVGTQVTYWGAQWWKLNGLSGLSGGTAPAAFKGFENNPAGTTDLTAWTTDPGNSSNPPASVPTYMAVIVSSSVSQNGSVISGDAPHVVIVKTDPGYAADPGHAGTGTVVATLR